MQALDIARKLAELQQTKDAQEAYTLALSQGELAPEEELEAASFIFFSEGDHRIAYTSFVSLYNRGLFREALLDLMQQAFYLPNVQALEKRYQQNLRALDRYPYIFRKDFPAFDELPIRFFPFDDKGYVPYYPAEDRFGEYVNFDYPVIDRWFFKDLSKPILADDVYSQYQLEYLNDAVRPSEWVAKENHIYLHYSSWAAFCAYLQVLDFKKLLNSKKLVFLMEEELCRYPIDFKAEYGIDYSTFPLKPVGVREVNRLVWHTQLSADNGGDFFNEIFHGHPNLLAWDSVMLDGFQEQIQDIRNNLKQKRLTLYNRLSHLDKISDKDILVAVFLDTWEKVKPTDPEARIAPAILFQPHFSNIFYKVQVMDDKRSWTTLWSRQYEQIRETPLFSQFKYIKTFTPMRRPSTSYAASVRTLANKGCIVDEEKKKNDVGVVPDQLTIQVCNRSFMIDPDDRLYQDSRLVRFEDGKLNPRATFTALAEFLDIPYTESMTYCSSWKGLDPESWVGNARGFDPRTVYATYAEYANEDEKSLVEYFLRDAYEAYGYDFQYYQGEPADEVWLQDKLDHCTTLDGYIRSSWEDSMEKKLLNLVKKKTESDEKYSTLTESDEDREKNKDLRSDIVDDRMRDIQENRKWTLGLLMRGLNFINREGQPLRLMTPLKLDPELLDQPLYH